MTAIWFDTNALYVDGVTAAFVAGTLTAEVSGDMVTVARANAGPQVFRRSYQTLTRVDGTSFASAVEAKAYLDGEFAKQRSLDLPAATARAAADLPAGLPVCISRIDGSLRPARADTYTEAFVIGLVTAPVVEGFVGTTTRNALTLDDWTAVAGTPSLAIGQPYFLGSAGGLTTFPDLTAGRCLVRIGNATGPQTLAPIQADPILL